MDTFLFDMDGVLVDSEFVVREAFKKIAEDIDFPEFVDMAVYGLGLKPDAWVKACHEHYGYGEKVEKAIEICDDYINAYYEHNPVPVKEGAEETLAYLKEAEYRLAIASSSPMADVKYRLGNAGLLDYIDAVVSGDMIVNSKPSPDIYLKAAEVMNRRPSDCFAVEDAPSGLKAATDAGCVTIFIPDLWKPEKDRTDLYRYRLPNLREIRKFLANYA